MLSCRSLVYMVGDFSLNGFSLELKKGDYCALLGPSGSGKTVILELIAGLRSLKKGSVVINGVDYTHTPPQQRPVGILFQDYALFPHMTVYENIAWPLKIRKIHKAEMVESVAGLAEELDIARLLERMPGSLSGGEKQRVALARTLVIHPLVLLLDEPLSALDAPLRDSSIALLGKLSKKGITILHVTHDPFEISSLANRSIFIGPGF
ncbi:MAG: ABC transporter ATP-binding protein [Bacteroidales bacterium]|nr:ABC transporter ATP-binding protein [Bacteroidales bacterium]MDD2831475.1 ABC transporter ATP-binding protein [Bacteroidales bacterium]MDD3208469.1 ABC transporter ATP-binding protein [Bacteroidales bacterium]MDD3697118.1 ABC transporter ATP-binding protein [Bacteroidales bacterium]MDD4167496.1 ABC transporter ATP-binding protein [Bacteroidales bacterium]